jgi:hypothetical protein
MRCSSVLLSLLALAIAGTPAQAVTVGAVYAGEFGGSRIFEYTPGLPPPVTSPVGPGLSSGVPVGGLAFDPTTGLLLVGDSFGNHVEMLDPTTGAPVSSMFLSQTSVVSGLAVDALTGDLWIGDEVRREVQHYDSTGFLIDRFSVLGRLPSGRPGGIALDANGDVWVGDSGASFVQQFTPNGFPLAGLGVPASRVGGLAFDVNGDLLVGELGPNTVYRMTTGGAFLSATDLNGLSEIGGLTVVLPEPSTFLLLVLGWTGAVVARRRKR